MKQYDAVVIGAGPGGYVCAIRLAQLGLKTAIVEKDKMGGVCLNVGCIPSKALIHAAKTFYNIKNGAAEMGVKAKDVTCDIQQMQTWKNGVVKKLTDGVAGLLKMNKVDSFKGTATFKDATTIEVASATGKEVIASKNFVIATGSRIVEIPTLKFNGKNILNSTEALDLTHVPKRMIVVGGGFIGIEIGMVYAKLGSQVSVVESSDRILPTTDRDLVQVVEKNMKKLGMTIYASARANGLKEKDPKAASVLHLDIEVTGQGAKSLEAECILVSVGRKPNSDGIGLEKLGMKIDPRGNIQTDQQGKTNIPGIYAIGDVSGPPQLAHRASMDGLLVAAAIAGEKSFKDYKTVPWAIFCDPEIATVGLTEQEAKDKGIKFRVGKFPFVATGRALSTNETEGFIKVLIEEKNELIIGVHMVGADVSNLIAEAALAIEMGACAEDVMRTIHTHPTLPEAFPEAIESAFYKAIHIYKAPPPKR